MNSARLIMPQTWLLPALIAIVWVAPQSGGQYELGWRTIDGGGAMFCTGGDFGLSGTIGQPDAGPVMTGGDLELAGGFWPGTTEPCVGDLDGDRDIDLADLAILLAAYDTCVGDPGFNPDADLDGSGCVELSDLATLLAVYGTTCE